MLNNDLYKLINNQSFKSALDIYSNQNTSHALESVNKLQEGLFSARHSYSALSSISHDIYRQRSQLTDLCSNMLKESHFLIMQTALKEIADQQSRFAGLTNMFEESQYRTMQTKIYEVFNQKSSLASLADMFKDSQYLTMQTALKEIADQQSRWADIFKESRYISIQTKIYEIFNQKSSLAKVADMFTESGLSFESFEKIVRQADYLQDISLFDIFKDLSQSNSLLIENNFTDENLSQEIIGAHNYQALSLSAKFFLWTIITILIFCKDISINVIANLAASELQNNIDFLQANQENTYKAIQSLPDLKKFLMQQNTRLTTANILHLRENPNTHSHILEELPKNTLIKVLDKSQRSWLFVEVEINGNIEQGWVYRRYTTHFK